MAQAQVGVGLAQDTAGAEAAPFAVGVVDQRQQARPAPGDRRIGQFDPAIALPKRQHDPQQRDIAVIRRPGPGGQPSKAVVLVHRGVPDIAGGIGFAVRGNDLERGQVRMLFTRRRCRFHGVRQVLDDMGSGQHQPGRDEGARAADLPADADEAAEGHRPRHEGLYPFEGEIRLRGRADSAAV